MGVFYHLRYPLLGLDIVARKVRRLMVFQSLSMPGAEVCEDVYDHGIYDREVLHEAGWPKMAFIEHRFAGDPTNWWVPNHAGVEAMLRSSGFCVIGRPGHEIYLCEPDPDHPSCVTTWNAAELQAAMEAVGLSHRNGGAPHAFPGQHAYRNGEEKASPRDRRGVQETRGEER
jgi:tRNA (mo5U34)-methyltransferase